MTCHEFLKQITVYSFASLQAVLDGHAKTEKGADLLKHLSSCSACAQRLSGEQQFRLLIKGHAPKVQAPESLLDKVLFGAAHQGLRESATPRLHEPRSNSHLHVSRFTFRPFAISLAAVCVLGLIALFSWMPWRSEQSTIFAVVDDHIRYLPSEEQRQIVSSNRAEVEAWFTGQLDFAVKVPEFKTLQLLGGRRCYLFGQRVALLFYEQVEDQPPPPGGGPKGSSWVPPVDGGGRNGAGKKLSLFILEDRGLNLEGMSWGNHGDKEMGSAASKGYNLVCWRQNGLAYALVSALSREILFELISQL